MTRPGIPEDFGRLTDLTGEMASHAEQHGIDTTAPTELTSDRVLEGSDPQNHATVVMADFKVRSIRFDPYWLETADRDAILGEGVLFLDEDGGLDVDDDRYLDDVGPRLNPGVPHWSE